MMHQKSVHRINTRELGSSGLLGNPLSRNYLGQLKIGGLFPFPRRHLRPRKNWDWASLNFLSPFAIKLKGIWHIVMDGLANSIISWKSRYKRITIQRYPIKKGENIFWIGLQLFLWKSFHFFFFASGCFDGRDTWATTLSKSMSASGCDSETN